MPRRIGPAPAADVRLAFLGACAGARAPLSYAVAWAGWEVTPVDLELNEGHSFAGDFHQGLWDRCDQFRVRYWAFPRSTGSRARLGGATQTGARRSYGRRSTREEFQVSNLEAAAASGQGHGTGSARFSVGKG